MTNLFGKTEKHYMHRWLMDWSNVISSDLALNEEKVKSEALLDDVGLEIRNRAQQTFCTGSSYTGQWNVLGFTGHGNYVYPHGVIYTGAFKDGMFHGKGSLTYPMGQKIVGLWDKGKLISSKFQFADGLVYEVPWDYCKMPDRRFNVELKNGFKPAPNEYLTNRQPTRKVPDGCYDCENGFYDPKTKSVMPAEETSDDQDPLSFIRGRIPVEIPSREYAEHIMKYYRKSGDDPAGYRPDFYEFWTCGVEKEVKKIEDSYYKESSETSAPFCSETIE